MRTRTLLTSAATLALVAMPASAALTLELTPLAGSPLTVVDGSGLDGETNPGVVSYSGALGAIDISVTVGVSNSPGGTSADLTITSLLIENTSSLDAGVTIRLSDTGFNSPAGTTLGSTAGGTFSGLNATSSVNFTSYADASNALFGLGTATAPLAYSFTTPPSQSFSGSVDTGFAGSLYSLTSVTVVGLSANGQVNFSGLTSVVPEPATLGAVAALSVAGLRRRR